VRSVKSNTSRAEGWLRNPSEALLTSRAQETLFHFILVHGERSRAILNGDRPFSLLDESILEKAFENGSPTDPACWNDIYAILPLFAGLEIVATSF
jgi:hypothetical protein